MPRRNANARAVEPVGAGDSGKVLPYAVIGGRTLCFVCRELVDVDESVELVHSPLGAVPERLGFMHNGECLEFFLEFGQGLMP